MTNELLAERDWLREQLQATTILNQALCEANMELTTQLEFLKTDYNQLLCQFRELTS